jgi:hypothetical protein
VELVSYLREECPEFTFQPGNSPGLKEKKSKVIAWQFTRTKRKRKVKLSP